MEIINEIATRKSLRALSDAPLPEGASVRIVQAGTFAPSCYNNQPWRIVAAEGDGLAALKDTLSEGNAWATRAPLIIAVAVRESDDCRLDDGRDYALFDAGLCTMNMIVQATAEGLIAHPIAGFNPKKAKAALGFSPDHVLIALLVVAKHGDASSADGALLKEWQKESETAPRKRKPRDEVAAFGRWPS